MGSLSLRSIHKSFGKVQVLKDISLEVDEGEFVTFVGPSGCGKSTLLRIIAGLEDADQGDVFIDDQRVNALPPAKRGIAMVFQTYALYPHLTVSKNMSLSLKQAGETSDYIRERVSSAADMLQLDELLERRPAELSGGQRQRVAIGRAFYRTAIFVPAILSFVIVGFAWKLILSPLWGVTPELLDMVGLKHLFKPWLGKEEYALTTLALISVWQFVGIPMMLTYAALLSIPDEVLEAAECDGITGMSVFWKIKLPLILPTIGIISILTFVGNFNAFDLVYASQGALAGPNYATDILGTYLYRTFFGFQSQLGNINMGATIAMMMFTIILLGVCIYLFFIQTRMRRYQF